VSTYPRLFVLSTGLLTATTQACLPIPFTLKEAPPVVGHYRDQSGAPLVGAEVSVTAYGKTDCGKPTYLVRTDSTGAFQVPQSAEHYSYIILLPIDHPAPNYLFCAQIGQMMTPVLRGYTLSVNTPDTLDCQQIQTAAGMRVHCIGHFRLERASFAVDTSYGTLTFHGTIDRADRGSEYEYRTHLDVTFHPGRNVNRTPGVDLIACRFVASIPGSDNGPWRILREETLPISVHLTQDGQTAHLPDLRFRLSKGIAAQARSVGLGVLDGRLMWPIPAHLQ
jgi:hypothetical protein